MKLHPIFLLLTATLLLFGGQAAAQTSDRIRAQKQIIEKLEKKIATEERRIRDLRSDRAATEKRVRMMARQIEDRTQLLAETQKQADLLHHEIRRTDSVANDLQSTLDRNREQYAEMVREAYRNYRHNNYLSYIFSSSTFEQVARKITYLREVSAMRRHKLEEIARLRAEVATQKNHLVSRRSSLDSVTHKLARQRAGLERDTRNAQLSIRQLSAREKQAIQRKVSQEQELDSAISALRKLTKGNTAGASFSAKTSGLRLPVVGGTVKRYKGNMAEIVGQRGAKVISIYEGKVMDIRQNRITGKYDVYVAHGQYITTYANLATVDVAKGAKVAKNGTLGTIGAAVNIMTMQPEYKMVFGIYPPNPKTVMRASDCFRK